MAQVASALRGGAAIIQYRDKSGQQHRERLAKNLLALCNQVNRPLIINDDVALCQRIGAHGVHLGQEDIAITDARELLGADAIIGATCHDSISLAVEAEQAGANYVAFGRFFPSATKPGAPSANLAKLATGLNQVNLPKVGIGGINLENAPLLIAAGFDLVAAVEDIFAKKDIASHCRQYARLFEQANP